MARYRWIEPTPVDDACFGLTDFPLLSEILSRRGICDADAARSFLSPRREDFGDPFDLPDLSRAVELVKTAVTAGKPIIVFGDYDADGVTSTAMLVRGLSRLGADVRPYLPHRQRDGYGLNLAAVKRAAAEGAALLITVDCGTSDLSELEHARSLGLRTVVLDHHHVTGAAIPADAFVSTQRAGAAGYRDFCAAGVAFQFLRALLDDRADDLLPFAALATVADVVPLTGANRAIVSLGLKSFATAPAGLVQLARQAGAVPAKVSAWDCGFVLGPRLNAAGRLDDPKVALDLLLTDDDGEGARLALLLNRLNSQRQQGLERLVQEAERRLVPERAREGVIVLSDPTWHVGLVGLAASRLAERHGRPAVVLAEQDGLSKGSARSVVGFNIVEALDACRDLLLEHGGHSQAAGLTLPTERLGDLSRRLAGLAEAALGTESLGVPLALDAEVYPKELTLETARALEALEPCGHGNRQPHLLLRSVRIEQLSRTRDGKHLRFRVRAGRHAIKAVFFGGADCEGQLRSPLGVDLAAKLTVSTWDGDPAPELHVVDCRPAT